jgi:hypothetical protein
MWVQVSTWIVQDDYVELGVGDRWKTVLDTSPPDNAEEMDPSTPLGLSLATEPLSIVGPVYDIVGEITEDKTAGNYLDTGSAILIPRSFRQWSPGTVLRYRSELRGGWNEMINPADVLLFSGVLRQLYVRWWKAVPHDEPNSYRADPDTVRFRPIERMSPWSDENNPDGDGRIISDYLLELV